MSQVLRAHLLAVYTGGGAIAVVEAYLEGQLQILQQRLCNPKHDAVATALIRGQIAQCRRMLADLSDRPIPQESD